ncbi:hypothetical protein [Methylopila sp. 73B]|uniref:hypothetical protein n=1 Tax=Methylopila sp. 73B TaxID=1120792 RepID=UPI0003660BFA|nr:hypothetical protein [Methylopila sp. 73B]
MRPASIEQLTARIERKRRAHRSIEGDLARLRDLRHAQLEVEVDQAQRAAGRRRRAQDGYQPELELDD